MKYIKITIDNHIVSIAQGKTILEAAKKIGIDIPTLCHFKLKGTCLNNHPSSCRVCVVEVEGKKNLAPACSTECENGMVIRTSSL